MKILIISLLLLAACPVKIRNQRYQKNQKVVIVNVAACFGLTEKRKRAQKFIVWTVVMTEDGNTKTKAIVKIL